MNDFDESINHSGIDGMRVASQLAALAEIDLTKDDDSSQESPELDPAAKVGINHPVTPFF